MSFRALETPEERARARAVACQGQESDGESVGIAGGTPSKRLRRNEGRSMEGAHGASAPSDFALYFDGRAANPKRIVAASQPACWSAACRFVAR